MTHGAVGSFWRLVVLPSLGFAATLGYCELTRQSPESLLGRFAPSPSQAEGDTWNLADLRQHLPDFFPPDGTAAPASPAARRVPLASRRPPVPDRKGTGRIVD